MPNYTDKLNLKKPLKQEQYNIDDFNGNADIIDTFATNVDTNITNMNTSISNLSANMVNKDLSNLTSTGEVHFANPSLSNLNSAGQAIFTNINTALNAKADDSNAVHKTGNETIAGTKLFTDNMWLQTDSDVLLGIKSTNVDWTQTPSRAFSTGKILFFDANHYEVGFLHSVIDQYSRSISLGSKNSLDTEWAFLSIGHNNSNNVFTYCPPCDFVNSIVTTTGINKSQNGYVKFGNGIILQWGRIWGTGELTVTFPIAFSAWNSYVIVKNYDHSGDQSLTDREGSFYGMTATTATTYKYPDDGDRNQWIAIGY